jgi:2-amino-4-hydroxy-6-hydroxymethyldihydropteridine diphosphokinase
MRENHQPGLRRETVPATTKPCLLRKRKWNHSHTNACGHEVVKGQGISDSGPTKVGNTAFLGLGSSLGDRVQHLQDAVDRLQCPEAGVEVVRLSALYESPHLGLQPGDDLRYPQHLNAVVQVQTHLSPLDLLAHMQAVEEAGGRQRHVRWGPRTIDVDLLLYGDLTLRTERLTLPHPGLRQRAFVVLPLHDLVPDLQLPDGTPVDRLARSEPILGQKIELFDAKLRLPI